ncbi:MAG: hypothetical protein JXB19_03390 [Bacteroidales bacterium]|nr:hypothetical protein [Bacteroidales bacterium]
MRYEAFNCSVCDLLIVGARFNPYGYRKNVSSYDTKNNLWNIKADFAGGPRMGSVAFSINGKNYAGSGISYESEYYYETFNDFPVYSPVINTCIKGLEFQSLRIKY